MTYPDLHGSQRTRALRQFRLLRMALAYHRKHEKEETDPPQYIRSFRLARRLAIHEQINAVRTMLHALFD